jgi:hypothetical protein
MPDLGSGAARRVGSSPIIRTEKASEILRSFFVLLHFCFFVVKVVDKQINRMFLIDLHYLFLTS